MYCLRRALAAAGGEDIDLVIAVRADEVAHVLGDAEDFDVHLVEHLDGLARILQRNVGGRGDDDGAGQRHGLGQRDHHVAGAGRQIDDEVVELSPGHAPEELLDDAVQHGTAPHQRLVSGIQIADRDGANAVALGGNDAVVGSQLGLAACAQHQRNVGAVDVGVEQSDLEAEARQSQREIDGESGFADSALAGADGNDLS